MASGPLLISSPVIAHGHIYLGSEHDGLICAGEPGQKRNPVWPSASGGPGVGGNPSTSRCRNGARLRGNTRSEQMGQSQEAVVSAPVAICGSTLYVPLAGSELSPGRRCEWTAQRDEAPRRPAWTYRTANPVLAFTGGDASHVDLVDGRIGDEGRQLHVLHPQVLDAQVPSES